MIKSKTSFYQEIDKRAESIANDFSTGLKITHRVLQLIIEMYEAAKVERKYKDEFFDTAYHAPISSELEFFIARILYHYSNTNDKGWQIFLRRQVSKTAPDIRLLKGGKTFAVIEVKAKAGWIQPFLSYERFQNDKKKLLDGKSGFDPDFLIENSRMQLKKYFDTFEITNKDVFLFLPTLALVHKEKYKTELSGYYEYFASTSGLPPENLILLSTNKRLDLSYRTDQIDPTDNFEKLITRLASNN